jgi:hypothetical protein
MALNIQLVSLRKRELFLYYHALLFITQKRAKMPHLHFGEERIGQTKQRRRWTVEENESREAMRLGRELAAAGCLASVNCSLKTTAQYIYKHY